MSVTIDQPPVAVERGADATAQLRAMFGFKNLKAMSTALAEVAVAEARANPAFAERIRQTYQEVAGTSSKPSRAPRPAQKKSSLKPIARVEGHRIDPFATLDPYIVYKMYGAEQFPLALNEKLLVELKDVADNLMATHPGTKPKTKSKKADVIDYIVEIVTGDQQK